MQIDPSIRQNFFTNAHPLGCEQTIKSYIEEAKSQESFSGPKNVLIIGGSSGYGLASRISLSFGAHANTLNISYESIPRGKRTGSAGYWNNVFFQHHTKSLGTIHHDIIGDAFSKGIKQDTIQSIKENYGKIDLVIYSLAAGARKNETTNELIRSTIKPIGKTVSGMTIDIATKQFKEITLGPATAQEIDDTVYVMGGSDWSDWIHVLDDAGCLSNGAKTIAYTYVGAESTKAIYREGTLGKAKEDLEQHARDLHDFLQTQLNGEALISSSKAVISKASVFIPKMPLYVSALFDVMKTHNVHESILEHKYRLFSDMVYGQKRLKDAKARLRMDHYELNDKIQYQTQAKMTELIAQKAIHSPSITHFLTKFYQINGFKYPQIDYHKAIDIPLLKRSYPLI
ncbi:MAG: enoyl-ACP reductase FabV [Candidatus Izemoplasma sp.]|nr:enoyl-ACP reductase FabV [Candidatus Izemoplasma sp.]